MSSCSGYFTIIGKTNKHNKKGSYIYCLCEFDDGGIVESDYTNISKGNIRSPNYPSIAGIGYPGQGKWKCYLNGKPTREYSLWCHMITRCYSGKCDSYYDVSVCERWHNFQNFCDDILYLPNYDKWIQSNRYELDKDFLCKEKNIYPKIYSIDTCMFIERELNTSEATTRKNLTGLTYIGISPEGEIFEFYNKKQFASEHKGEISLSSINRCINENRTIKQWKFKIKDDI